MTKDEIRLVAFLIVALIVGTAVKHWGQFSAKSAPVAIEEHKTGWVQPPYVFKTRAAMERVRENLPATSAQP